MTIFNFDSNYNYDNGNCLKNQSYVVPAVPAGQEGHVLLLLLLLHVNF
jgi:hypothetical protein